MGSFLNPARRPCRRRRAALSACRLLLPLLCHSARGEESSAGRDGGAYKLKIKAPTGLLRQRIFMARKSLRIIRELAEIYSRTRIPRASAALSYYFTMTLFPLIICLYTLLGSNYSRAVEVLDFAERFLTEDTVRIVEDFLDYVAASNSQAMLAAGLAVLVTSASAAVRTLQTTVGEMQGGKRFQGLMDFIFSIIFSLVFLAAMYFAILVIISGQEVLELVNRFLPFVDISSSWSWLRFLLLAGILFVIFWGVYEVSKRQSDRYKTFPGAILSTAATVVMSFVFSVFIGASAKYPLVYGSLASVILLMFWLHLCCQIIFIGAAFNIALRNDRLRLLKEKLSRGSREKE